MTDRERLQSYVETWRTCCADLVALGRGLDADEWDRPSGLPGWTVADVYAHTAHLEAVLAGTPHEEVELPDSPHARGAAGLYTEQGVHARRGQAREQLLDELEAAVEQRTRLLHDDPPTDGRAKADGAPGDWDWDTLLSNRVVDVWMHEQDVRRAVGRPGGMDSPGARHVVGAFLRGMPIVLGKRVGLGDDQTVVLDLVDAGTLVPFAVEDGKVRMQDAAPGSPTTQLRMTAETFTVLCGGRHDPADVQVEVLGDVDLASRILPAMALTP